MAETDSRSAIVPAIVLVCDIIFVVACIVLDKTAHVTPPAGGSTDTSAPIGWLSVLSATFIFGCYGVLIKSPAVARANPDCMVFQCYYGTAVAVLSLVIWLVAGSSDGLTLTGGSYMMGLLFGFLWTTSQLCSFHAIKILGYAVGPAVWIGVTICTSFAWGTICFGNPIESVPGATVALCLLVSGAVLAALSSHLSDKQQAQARQRVSLELTVTNPEGLTTAAATKTSEGAGAGHMLLGLLACVGCGFTNGSIMVPMRCFDKGCPSIGVEPFTGNILAPIAFLPSLAFGVLSVTPAYFLVYFCRDLLRRRPPAFHFKDIAVPGFLTGCFWGMGNFTAMFATVYLGQTIGFPLTQCCLIINGLWGILYFKEVSGRVPIMVFVLASAVILGGATLDGLYG